jgi:hypothetical protein
MNNTKSLKIVLNLAWFTNNFTNQIWIWIAIVKICLSTVSNQIFIIYRQSDNVTSQYSSIGY